MKTTDAPAVSAGAVIPAPPREVYAILAEYRGGHARIITTSSGRATVAASKRSSAPVVWRSASRWRWCAGRYGPSR